MLLHVLATTRLWFRVLRLCGVVSQVVLLYVLRTPTGSSEETHQKE